MCASFKVLLFWLDPGDCSAFLGGGLDEYIYIYIYSTEKSPRKKRTSSFSKKRPERAVKKQGFLCWYDLYKTQVKVEIYDLYSYTLYIFM